jgi:hypothetical protein
MTKVFIEIKQHHKKFKLHLGDIGRVFKINKKKSPAIPLFGKILLETDDDMDSNVASVQ